MTLDGRAAVLNLLKWHLPENFVLLCFMTSQFETTLAFDFSEFLG